MEGWISWKAGKNWVILLFCVMTSTWYFIYNLKWIMANEGITIFFFLQVKTSSLILISPAFRQSWIRVWMCCSTQLISQMIHQLMMTTKMNQKTFCWALLLCNPRQNIREILQNPHHMIQLVWHWKHCKIIWEVGKRCNLVRYMHI